MTRNFKVPVCAAGVRSSSQALIAMGLGASSVILREPLAGCIEAPHGGQATMPLHHTQLEHPRGETACMLFFWGVLGECSGDIHSREGSSPYGNRYDSVQRGKRGVDGPRRYQNGVMMIHSSRRGFVSIIFIDIFFHGKIYLD